MRKLLFMKIHERYIDLQSVQLGTTFRAVE